MPDIFLSYSRDDLSTARRFAEAFEREGFSVWWDQTLNPGEAFDEVTEKALNEARAVVVLWSKKSVASRWVRAEATQANDSKTLVPVMIEPCKRPIMFELTHTADLSNWKGNPDDPAWQSYLAGVKRVVGKQASGELLPAPMFQPAKSPRQYGMRTAIGVVAIAVVVAGAMWLVNRNPKIVPTPKEAVDATSPAAAREATLAVLPFADMSTAKDQEAFSDGLAEEILNRLAQVKGLVVTGRTSSFSFKGKNEDLRSIAKQLGVANLLEGSVRKEGSDLRITAQLIEGKTGTHRWSKTYKKHFQNLLAMQDEIASDVAIALSVALGNVEFSHAEGGTNVPEALEKFLQARALSQQGKAGNPARIVQLTREAVKLDPNFALAWFMLADYLRPISPSAPPDAAQERERIEARKQFDATIPPSSGMAAFVRAYTLLTDRNWVEAEPVVMTAYDAGPKYSRYLASNVYVGFLLSVGRAREAVLAAERLRSFDPLAMGPSVRLQDALDIAGRPDEAQTEYVRSRTLEGSRENPEYLATIRLLLRPNVDMAAVRSQFQRFAANQESPHPLYAKLAGQLSDRKAIRETLASALTDLTRQSELGLETVAQLAAAFGERDLALTAIRRSIDHGAPVSIVWIPSRGDLRTDPGFKDIVRELGLVDYWHASGNWGDFCKPVGKDDFECH